VGCRFAHRNIGLNAFEICELQVGYNAGSDQRLDVLRNPAAITRNG
jgi:hypothetical protein